MKNIKDMGASSSFCHTCHHSHDDHVRARMNVNGDFTDVILGIRKGCKTCFMGKKKVFCSHCKCTNCSKSTSNAWFKTSSEKYDYFCRNWSHRPRSSSNRGICKDCNHDCHEDEECNIKVHKRNMSDSGSYLAVYEQDRIRKNIFNVNGNEMYVDLNDSKKDYVNATEYDYTESWEDSQVVYYVDEQESYQKTELVFWYTKHTYTERPRYDIGNRIIGYERTDINEPVYRNNNVTAYRTVKKPRTRTEKKKVTRKVPKIVLKMILQLTFIKIH